MALRKYFARIYSVILQFPDVVEKHANARKRAQMSAKESLSANASPQKSAKENKRAQKSASAKKKSKQPGLKQPGLGTPK